MPPLRTAEHPGALFSLVPMNPSLVPMNPRADGVVSNSRNQHLAWLSEVGEDGKQTTNLSVGFNICSKKGGFSTIATIGRGDDVDIYVEGSAISKLQCTFQIHLGSKKVMLFDNSTSHTTQVYSGDKQEDIVRPFEHERPLPRSIVVTENLNNVVGMGGEARNLVLFRLHWHRTDAETLKYIQTRQDLPKNYQQEYADNPGLAQTRSQEHDTTEPSRMQTRAHTPSQLRMRYTVGDRVGKGSYGDVYQAVNLDTGSLVAMKVLRVESSFQAYLTRKREVETLARISHLGDFGLCNPDVHASTSVGTPLYKAPELAKRPELQSSKMDIWSLMVTMLWVLDIESFRMASFSSEQEICNKIVRAVARSPIMTELQMCSVEPTRRPSAAQLLVLHFKGSGLTTHPNAIPPLN
ncbi:MAG: hypothetical protein Q9223_005125 [Gallowayella weberi]